MQNVTATSTEPDPSIAKLRADITGQVITPDDPGYDRARTAFVGGFDRRPAVIVRVADATDVARVIAFARETGLPLAVRSGGHSLFCVADGAVVCDMSRMKTLTIDVESRTAWAEAGVTAGQFTTAAAEHGLATGFGDTGSVGLGGLTLGGGVGYLVRKYGLTIDDLLAVELVTAEGELLHVDAESHPDLFWALRGGGGNFGVVTRLRYRLHELDMVYGGLLILPAEPEVIAGYMRLAGAAPDELSSIVNIVPAPPMPFVPEELHGKLILMAMMVYAGNVEDGEQAVAPFRALATPLADMVQPMPYAGVYEPEDENYHPRTFSRTLLVDEIDVPAAEKIMAHLNACTAPVPVAQLRALGGAMARVPNDATAFAHRDRAVMFTAAVVYEDPAEAQVHEAWISEFTAAMRTGDVGAYVNFLDEDAPGREREAYPGTTWDRLVEIKRRYDPTNLFRLNVNIPPA
jgi:FAD/FMN-containing dehydrogenase